MSEPSSCLFCRIVREEIPATVVLKQDRVTAFRDIAPRAPTHILIVPDEHIPGAAEVKARDEAIVGRLVRMAAEIARREGIGDSGYRLIINQGPDASQSVDHLHVHLIGGRKLLVNMV